jgi:uncharacterized protein YecE (DUF72 family)
MRPARPPIRIGTSGWSYAHWQPTFYPAGLPRTRWLEFYSGRFSTVEINGTFYKTPKRATLISWREAVPADFTFAVKASRQITHMHKLKSPRGTVAPFLKRIAVLGERLGPILFQLPPRWRVDAERLRGLLRALSSDFRYAFEFRDPSWIEPAVLDLLEQHGAAFCIYELDHYLAPQAVTADFVYVRLHGPGAAYRGSYMPATLAAWARRCRAWQTEGRAVYCYFDNDENGYAAKNAASLGSRLGD